ncbi:23S rRNA (cytidine1920-2'-O)/16S rRNA (cytidine1409-2'-O)-methyltransferase [Vogesella indigofera]|uniref:23S rRNA (Cytidine1920-2'-O)/16S rRNA (Cytidine1409-2'-O)-methyltransferase n=1 Tax=Vogesella indigofera TaxID=45465 RepID=A0A495BG59_VOGIN|nr:TlyA family RNA methyltransferase [Vogesella indigofera]RKQ60070.1 23S rRNA (cytidine1920-2'-O)/16S rRNA (cytidine1409-2'-O)-methyltransferase [Vogesella indigofera]
MQRVDLLLVELGLAPSRTAAQALIAAGRVSVDDGGQLRDIGKASQKLPADSRFVIVPDEADRYVSRGGLKMAGALAQAGLRIDGWTALDVGQSTGGFSDCLLQAGARRVVGVDVGHDQLAPRLAADPRIVAFEGVNARALDHAALLAANDGAPFDLMVCDVSFISLALVYPSALPLIRPGGYLLSLVKPQFEVGREGLGHGGIVRDAQLYAGVEQRISALVAELGFQRLDWFDSPIKGGDGNREFFIFAQRHASA